MYYSVYTHTNYDKYSGEVISQEARTHYYRKIGDQRLGAETGLDGDDMNFGDDAGPYLEFDSQFGVTGYPGPPEYGMLNEPVCVQTFRHFIFVMEANSHRLSVFSLNHNKTSEFRYITHLYRPHQRMMVSFAVSATGYVW